MASYYGNLVTDREGAIAKPSFECQRLDMDIVSGMMCMIVAIVDCSYGFSLSA